MKEQLDLLRFKNAQALKYEEALKEIKNGEKQSHWMWYIFPQIKGLGYSFNAQYYGIQDLQEAKEYLNDEILGKRLIEISKELLELKTNNATKVFGYPDDIKLCSSMTLFAYISENDSVFHKVLEKYFDSKMDELTLNIINNQ